MFEVGGRFVTGPPGPELCLTRAILREMFALSNDLKRYETGIGVEWGDTNGELEIEDTPESKFCNDVAR